MEVELVNIWKKYNKVDALRGVNLVIPRGQITAVLGPSGCGKTTLLKIIAGLVQPDEGRVLFDGVDYTNVPTEKRGVGMVFQDLALFPHMTVYDNVAFGLRVKKVREEEVRSRVKTVLELIGLDPSLYANRRIDELSGGEQQRVALARSLVVEPKVLLLDEPMAHLDYKIKQRLLGEIRRLQKILGITMIYVTHDQTEAMSMADEVVVMSRGVVLQHGPQREVYEKPLSLDVASFFGDVNVLEATFAGIKGEGVVAIRPEDIEVNPSEELDVVYEGTVEDLVFQGPLIRLDVRVNGNSLKVLVGRKEFGRMGIGVGSRIRVGWRLEDLKGAKGVG
ncbi:MAG: ABC transporter ATP-binding protein [Acidilobaceae archaeon]|nr:ABC transporter ATP-binding protein [Acidilobaceae archaeon]MCX8165591.1 ABC transporter ATP-binding protein [Acidilobaceae archaeon]MDW7974018.1 ABC transporter ATP-binding protein [Sulfolobales archaeon]